MTDQIERVARVIASAMGDNFADAFKNKDRWVAKRGMSGGRFRDVNEPFQADYLDAARAAIDAMQAWQPIESAPKDGTPIILGYADTSGKLAAKSASWRLVHPRWENEKRGWAWVCTMDSVLVDPRATHWMPLPTAPTQGNEL